MMKYVPKHKEGVKYYYDCDYCGLFHPEGYDGPCDEEHTFTDEQLDEKHGKDGWMLEAFAELIEVEDTDNTTMLLEAA